MKKKTTKKPRVAKIVGATTPPPAVAAAEQASEQASENSTADATEQPSEPSVFEEAAGFESSYQRFESEARTIADADVQVVNAKPMVFFHNARKGARAVLAERARIEADPDAPRVDFARIEATVRVGEATVFAARRAALTVARRNDALLQTPAMFETRDALLTNAQGLVKAKVVTKKEEADKLPLIIKGSGPIDGAQDCIDLVAWFRRNESAAQGKTPITAAYLEATERMAAELLHALSPDGVAVASNREDPVAEAAQMRDRMASLLVRYHAYVARIGGWLWGLDVSEHVPPLRARSVSRATTAQPTPPTPPSPPDAPR